MSSRTLVVATVMQWDENTTPIGRQLIVSVFRVLTLKASSKARSISSALADTCFRLITPNENRPPCPELVSTSATSSKRSSDAELVEREPIERVALGQQRAQAAERREIGHVFRADAMFFEQRAIGRHVGRRPAELGQQPRFGLDPEHRRVEPDGHVPSLGADRRIEAVGRRAS